MAFTLASFKNMKHFKYGICYIILPLTYQQDTFLKETTANVRERSIAKYLIFENRLFIVNEQKPLWNSIDLQMKASISVKKIRTQTNYFK